MVAGPERSVTATAGESTWAPKGLLAALIVGVAVVGIADLYHAELREAFAIDHWLVDWLRDKLFRPFKWSITLNFLSPWFFVCMPLFMLAEHLRPADPDQGLITRGLFIDALWVPVREVGRAVFVFWLLEWNRQFYVAHLDFLTIEALRAKSWGVNLLLAVVMFDFIKYVVHWIHHQVPFLWAFHAVHHSQRELNALTERRVHPFEFLFTNALYAIPLGILSIDVSAAAAAAVVVMWHTRLTHVNWRTDFGPLRYVLVTPQSHRVHHGVDPRFHNTNYGATFSVWDQLFGTQHRGWDDYPETGIEDETFPFEQDATGLRLLVVPLLQSLHPFAKIARREAPGSRRLPDPA